jgi:hypothetical protein
MVLAERIAAWLDDPESWVEYAEEVGERWAVRVRQESRDVTTVWFWPRQVSLEYEAYFLPIEGEPASVFRQALARNQRSWRCFFALDGEGGLVLRGRLAAAEVTMENLDLVLGEIVDMVDVAFRPMLRSMLNDRETSG